MPRQPRHETLRKIAAIRAVQREQAQGVAQEAARETRRIAAERAAMSNEIARGAERWATSMSGSSFDPLLSHLWLDLLAKLDGRARTLVSDERVVIAREATAARMWYEAEMRFDDASALAHLARRRVAREREEARLLENEDRVARGWMRR